VKIIILGAGQVGRTAAFHLSREEGNDVTVIDVNEEILRDLQDRLDIRTVAGNASYPPVLEAAGATWVRLQGSFEARLAQAIEAIDALAPPGSA